ncbi:Tannase/feruloyl esterase [Podospora australis]|uniref:Carboxylic ester hydrolase n=1 Tax=Podospora australis TaxID=1536484 RepID=A0AAN6X3C0_9PEZI|nr:Tannase/feruloyl esterase [Podospora australis]
MLALLCLLLLLFKGQCGVSITPLAAVSVPKNGTFAEEGNKSYPQRIDLLPALCAVTLRVTNTSSQPVSTFKVGLFLPEVYTKRLLTVGSGSFSGGINWPGMAEGVHYGFATISSDNGHDSAMADLSWGLSSSQDRKGEADGRLLDWGYRAVHGSVVIGRLITDKYYGPAYGKILYSYFSGCSTGGRQGLREAQYDAASFDGMLIGAPAWDTKHLMPWISSVAYELLWGGGGGNGERRREEEVLDARAMGVLAAEVQRQCDAADGVVDGVISAPDLCQQVDLRGITCEGDPGRCISPRQAEVVMQIWGDWKVGKGNTTVYHGFSKGSEDQWAVYFGDKGTLRGFDFDYWRFWVMNQTDWDWRGNWGDGESVARESERVNPGQATADDFERMEGFKRKGGKIVMYHGLSDGILSPRSSMFFYNQMRAALNEKDVEGKDTRGWFRYFEVPGMQHCWFSNRYNAPWHFGGSGQATQLRLLPYLGVGLPALGDGWSVPGHLGDAEYDALVALVRWVEGGDDKPVERVVATAYDAGFKVYRTRPLCAWPERAVYRGAGDVNDASSWECA